MMELTPKQKEQVRQSRAAGVRRVTLRFTAEQRKEWRAAAQQGLAGKEENLAYFHKLKAAAERPGFFGDVRRAMAASRRTADELAGEIVVEPRLLSNSRAGEAELRTVRRRCGPNAEGRIVRQCLRLSSTWLRQRDFLPHVTISSPMAAPA